ncbi:hypothetical protein HDU76_013877 [Blyttiomyces sp. JEL0837]|nr:hypothetical protein HDU76_013877 [Blyttiomyces sp. JEL0837]
MPKGLTVRIASGQDEIDAAFRIRIEVFCDEQGFPQEVEIDDKDPISTHFLLWLNEKEADEGETSSTATASSLIPIGTVRLFSVTKPGSTDAIGKLGRLAILKDHRGRRGGRLLVEALEQEARRLGLRKIELHAQIPMIKFYEHHGYELFGEQFDEDGAPHILMKRDL